MLLPHAVLSARRMHCPPSPWRRAFTSARRALPHVRCHLHIRILLLIAAICFVTIPFWPTPVEPFSPHSTPDIVGVAVKPTCTSQRAIQALNQHVRPAHIHVITSGPAQCAAFIRMAPNVICHKEYDLIPGVNHSTVAEYLQNKFGSIDSVHRGRKLAGWYLQQFLKLGAAAAIPNLSEHFVVWDLDMILLRPIAFLDNKQGVVRTAVNRGGARNIPGYEEAYRRLTGHKLAFAPDGSSFVTHWMVVYKPFMKELLDTITHAKLHIEQTGGANSSVVSSSNRRLKSTNKHTPQWSSTDRARLPASGPHDLLNQALLSKESEELVRDGRQINHVSDDSRNRGIWRMSESGNSAGLPERGDHNRQPDETQVTHAWGSRDGPRVLRAGGGVAGDVDAVNDGGAAAGGAHADAAAAGSQDFKAAAPWVWKILDAVPSEYVNLGFSEYATYVSFVMARHPETQFVLPRRSWVRTPGGAWLVTFLRKFHPQGCCCPCDCTLHWLSLLGYHYTGFETGHVEACDFTSPKYELAYCLDEDALL